MRTRQVLPYLAALLLLAWILGTLARSGTADTSILAGSYWLFYLVYLIPVLALGAMVVMMVYLAINWKLISDVLGFGLARRRREKRKSMSKHSSLVRLGVWGFFWGLAVAVLYWKCGGIFCSSDYNQTLTDTVAGAVGGDPELPIPSLAGVSGRVAGLAEFISSPVFALAFLGLLIVSTVIMARGLIVSFREDLGDGFLPATVVEMGTMAVQDALRVLENVEGTDPRTRIVNCYGKMIRAAAALGANVKADQTARELETGIRGMFRLEGPGIAELTRLFEEARYSLHPITDADSEKAQLCLVDIGEELKAKTSTDASL